MESANGSSGRKSAGDGRTSGLLKLLRPKPTGRVIVSFERGMDVGRRAEIVTQATGSVVAAQAFPTENEVLSLGHESSSSALLARFGLAVVADTGGMQTHSLVQTLQDQPGVLTVRPEFYLFNSEAAIDTQTQTWGLGAIGADRSRFTGKGVKLAILDTGLDFAHVDFQDRAIVSRSFIEGETAEDVKGHGTHCAGTAAARTPATGMRYGVAPDVDLFIAKVLNNKGAGAEAQIIAGILWAIEEGCDIISMSLGRSVREGEIPTAEYEAVAKVALESGSLIMAAAGNNSTRQFGFIAPVSEPANSPSIMAVAALDVDLSVAHFSNGAVNPKGGVIDIAAPGVSVISSVPGPQLYDKLSGTSMACPHVAGAAALWAQSDPTLRGQALWDKLVASARRLPHDISDVGAGLVQCPVASDVPIS